MTRRKATEGRDSTTEQTENTEGRQKKRGRRGSGHEEQVASALPGFPSLDFVLSSSSFRVFRVFRGEDSSVFLRGGSLLPSAHPRRFSCMGRIAFLLASVLV